MNLVLGIISSVLMFGGLITFIVGIGKGDTNLLIIGGVIMLQNQIVLSSLSS